MNQAKNKRQKLRCLFASEKEKYFFYIYYYVITERRKKALYSRARAKGR
jgi:hypothetical protein